MFFCVRLKCRVFENYEFEHLTIVFYELPSGSNIALGVKLKLEKMKCEQKKKRRSRLKNRSSRRKNESYDASNSAGVDFDFQADQAAPQCRWENSKTRPLCAILGSEDMFRVKTFEGIPYTHCPLADGAIPIIELPYLVVMGSISEQKLTKVSLHVLWLVNNFLTLSYVRMWRA